MSRWIGLGIIVAVLALAVWLYLPTFAGTRGAAEVETPREASFLRPDPSSYARFLEAVVTDNGRVNYDTALGPARADLNAYLDQVARATPARFEHDDQRLAFYLNAYNALIIAGVLDYWPIDSIEDVGALHAFFRERKYTIAGQRVSFHGFETKIIKRYDSRFHFALNCASASCPPLRREPYRGEALNAQLEDQARRFINDPALNAYDSAKQTWSLSKIFAWYASDFGGEDGIRALLRRYATFDWPEDAAITYREYDWSLNKPLPDQDPSSTGLDEAAEP